MTDHQNGKETVMTRLDEHSRGAGDLWGILTSGMEQGDLQSSLDHLTAGRPICLAEKDTPDTAAIRKCPDGRRELVRFDSEGEHAVRPLPAMELRI